MCEHCPEDRLIVAAISDVEDTHFTVCFTGTEPSEDNPEEREVFGHFHFRVDKGVGNSGVIHIVDVNASLDDKHGVSIPNDILHAFARFMSETLQEDPTLVMTDREQAQFTADTLVAAYHQNTN